MRLISFAAIWFCFASTAFAQKVGDTVYVKVTYAKMKSEATTVKVVSAGYGISVDRIQGEWLWVNSYGKQVRIKRSEVGSHDDAIETLTQYIRNNPKSPDLSTAYYLCGLAWHHGTGEIGMAKSKYNDSLRLDPNNSKVYTNRGSIWNDIDEFDKSIKDLNEAIRLDPKFAYAYMNRGFTWHRKGEYDKALNDYNKAIKLYPKFSDAYNFRGWLYATCTDSRYRNGKQAVKDATKACEQTGWKEPGSIDTLAAAYAEKGDFANAVKMQQKGIDLFPAVEKADFSTRIVIKNLVSRLELYKAGKPYREEAMN